MDTNRSELHSAFKRLEMQTATALREGTHLRLPLTMKIGDANRCDHLARNPSSIDYLRDDNTFTTRLILRTVNEAWKQDKLPAIAICTSESAAKALQQSTDIQTVTADKFLKDMAIARPVTQMFTARRNYVIGHDSNPEGRFDKIVLPANANLIVYEAEKFSPHQLASLCNHVRSVCGRLILCAPWEALAHTQPEIAKALTDFFGDYGSQVPYGTNLEKAWELGTETEPAPIFRDVELQSSAACPWVVVASSPWHAGAYSVRSIHSSKEEALTAAPAVFAEEWKEYSLFLESGWTDHRPPSVSAAEWRLSEPPSIGDSVRCNDHAVVSLIGPDERLPLHDVFREDSGELDPLANRRPFLVFHANSQESANFPENYTLVARIEAESLEHALLLSKHSDVPWTKYRGVTPFVEHPRSIQIGDVLIDHDMPFRYSGPNRWRPATTGMGAVDTCHIVTELGVAEYTQDAHEHRIEPQRAKI